MHGEDGRFTNHTTANKAIQRTPKKGESAFKRIELNHFFKITPVLPARTSRYEACGEAYGEFRQYIRGLSNIILKKAVVPATIRQVLQ